MAFGPVASQVAEAQGSGEGWLCESPTQALLVWVGLGREQGSHRGTSLVPYLKDILVCIFHNQIYDVRTVEVSDCHSEFVLYKSSRIL